MNGTACPTSLHGVCFDGVDDNDGSEALSRAWAVALD